MTTTSNSASWGEPLNLDKLNAMLDLLPKRETWVSSRFFPPGSALVCDAPDEKFVCLNQADMPALLAKLRQTGSGDLGRSIIELDAHDSDSPSAAEWREKERRRVFAVVIGMMGAGALLNSVFPQPLTPPT